MTHLSSESLCNGNAIKKVIYLGLDISLFYPATRCESRTLGEKELTIIYESTQIIVLTVNAEHLDTDGKYRGTFFVTSVIAKTI